MALGLKGEEIHFSWTEKTNIFWLMSADSLPWCGKQTYLPKLPNLYPNFTNIWHPFEATTPELYQFITKHFQEP